ncbi:MAG: hypothetical protein ACRDCW_11240 [Sarcina sp.]
MEKRENCYENIYVDKLGKREATLVVGAPGTGKSYFISNFVEFGFRNLFFNNMKSNDVKDINIKDSDVNKELKSVEFEFKGNVGTGKTLSIVRLMKYNITNHSDVKDKVLICFKRKDAVSFRELLNDLLCESFYSTVIKFRTGEADNIEVSNYFKERLFRELKESIFYDFLEDEINGFIKDEFEDFMPKAIFNLKSMDMMYLYSLAKNKIPKNDKANEQLVKEAIKKQIFLSRELTIGRFAKDFDLNREREERSIWNLMDFKMESLLETLNYKTNKYFEDTLGEYSISRDGYYVKEFTRASLNGSDLSLLRRIMNAEANFMFIDEMVVTLPLNKNVERVIKEKGNSRLINRHGDIALSMYDYNYNHTDNIDREYKLVEEFVYGKDINAIVNIREGNKKDKLNDGVLEEIGRRLNKYIDLFVVHNKMDLLMDEVRRREFENRDDILELKGSNSFEFSRISDERCREIIERVENHTKGLLGNFEQLQSMKKKPLAVHVAHMFCAYNNKPEPMLIDKFAPINFIKLFIDNIAKAKVKALCVEFEGLEDSIKVDKLKVARIVGESLHSKESRKCITAIRQNICENIGLEIDRDTFRQVEHRIKVGETLNYSSQGASLLGGVNIQFPSNFKNMITEKLVKEVIDKAINFENIKISREAKELMITEVIKLRAYIAKEAVGNVLYKELTEVTLENSLEVEGVIFDKYLSRLYDNMISLDKLEYSNSKSAIIKENFKVNLNESIADAVLGYVRLIFKE